MKLLANENFPLTSVLYLRDKDYDIISIGEDNPSIKDEEVIEIAIREERTILTFDRDYGELIFKKNYKPEKGVIYLRIEEFTPEFPGTLLHDLFEKEEIPFENALTVIDKFGIRQRRY